MHLRIGQGLPRLANTANNSTRLLWLTTLVQKIRLEKWALRIAEDTSSSQTGNFFASSPSWESERSKTRGYCGPGEQTDTNKHCDKNRGQ
jgi:hypothetical protein